jgi:hypothetical protein
MMSRRTKVILWLSMLPIVAVIGVVVSATIYPYLLQPENRATYFFLFHVRWLPVLLGSVIIFGCGLTSLIFDYRNAGRK